MNEIEQILNLSLKECLADGGLWFDGNYLYFRQLRLGKIDIYLKNKESSDYNRCVACGGKAKDRLCLSCNKKPSDSDKQFSLNKGGNNGQ